VTSDREKTNYKVQGTVNRVSAKIVKNAVANVIADKKQKIISIVDIS
jgi:hypothetical protein